MYQEGTIQQLNKLIAFPEYVELWGTRAYSCMAIVFGYSFRLPLTGVRSAAVLKDHIAMVFKKGNNNILWSFFEAGKEKDK